MSQGSFGSKSASPSGFANSVTSYTNPQASGNTKRKVSVSGNLIASFSSSPFDFGGRSYVISGPNSKASTGSPAVHLNFQIDEQTASSAAIGVTGESFDDANDNVFEDDAYISLLPPIEIYTDYEERDSTADSIDPHVVSDHRNSISSNGIRRISDTYAHYSDEIEPQLESDALLSNNYFKYTESNKYGVETQDVDVSSGTVHEARIDVAKRWILKPINYIPAVFLGTLLNILDGLSYGMIMFPLSEVTFAALGPAGLSMFYMSCIISQLVYSLGGSAFKSGIGSEMIEVTPFFHAMAFLILAEMGSDNKDAVIATTITTYAISSIVTGFIFFLLGKLKLGSLVGFFPRHILVGCIGGVGYFLVVTGIQVSSRLDGELSYTLDTFKFLFGDHIVFLRWVVPLLLAALLIAIQTRFHNLIIVPMFFILVFCIFHLIILVVPSWTLDTAREFGWVFPAVEDNEPWYSFYELYKFNLVDWWCIARQFPTMLALTFFGILHVPINVPALAVTVKMDEVDVDRELVAHGYSNALSGLVGSIQNYLVYTNSVLFLRAGADDRLAGVLLAVATGAVMVAGPIVIGYIPVCVVGALIYLLGYELLKEALYDTYGRLTRIEYLTIIIIVVVMGAWDFVYGVLAGILLACLSFVVEAATTPVVQGMYTGVVARLTVLRHPKQQEFLRDVGNQICVVKLQGTLFFGLIGGVEATIRSRFEVENFKKDPVKFLILDMKGIVSIDFSACEGFRRILNLVNEFDTQLIISSVQNNDETVKALRDAGLWDTDNELDIQLFSTLNYALEWCESSFLATYKNVVKQKGVDSTSYDSLGMTRNKLIVGARSPMVTYDTSLGTTPRTTQVYQAATRTAKSHQTSHSKYFNSNDSMFKKQPLPLLMLTFQGLSNKDAEFWSKAASFFVKEQVPENFTFYDTSSNRPAFFVVESGLVKSLVRFESEEIELHSSILPLTAFGDLFEANASRPISYTTVSDLVLWKLSERKVQELLATPDGLKVYTELMVISNKLTRERFDTMTANLVLS